MTPDNQKASPTLQVKIPLQLKTQITKNEGIIEYAYQDDLGYWTIGIGRLIDKRKGGKLSIDEIYYLLNNDLNKCATELHGYVWFIIQDEVRQGVLIELCFNLGLTNLLKFTQFIGFMAGKDFYGASQDLKTTLWAKQVKQHRVDNICFRLEKGIYPA